MLDLDTIATGHSIDYALCFHLATVAAFQAVAEAHWMRRSAFDAAFSERWGGDDLPAGHDEAVANLLRKADWTANQRALWDVFPPYPKRIPKSNMLWIQRLLPKFLRGTGLLGFDTIMSHRHTHVANGILRVNPRSLAVPPLRTFATRTFFPLSLAGMRPTWGMHGLFEYYVGGVKKEPNRLRFSTSKVIVTHDGIIGTTVPEEVDLHYF